MAEELAHAGAELFLYSPHYVDTATGMAKGFSLASDGFTPTYRAVPHINGNWYYGYYPHDGDGHTMSMPQFREWARCNQRSIFPSHEFSCLAADKLLSHDLITQFDSTLPPFTQEFRHSTEQLSKALDAYGMVFLKPRFGGHGDGILVIEAQGGCYDARLHKDGLRWQTSTTSLHAIIANIQSLAHNSNYVIQPAINAQCHEGRVFDIRVMLVATGDTWCNFPTVRQGAAGNDISNIGQGGTLHAAEEFMGHLYPATEVRQILAQVNHISLGFGEFLQHRFGNTIPELALDFVLDRTGKPWLVEFNIQPGMVFPGLKQREVFYATYQDIFHLTDDERPVYERYTRPYGACLGRFFAHQIQTLAVPEYVS